MEVLIVVAGYGTRLARDLATSNECNCNVIISFMMYTHQRTDGNLYQQPIITNYNIS